MGVKVLSPGFSVALGYLVLVISSWKTCSRLSYSKRRVPLARASLERCVRWVLVGLVFAALPFTPPSSYSSSALSTSSYVENRGSDPTRELLGSSQRSNLDSCPGLKWARRRISRPRYFRPKYGRICASTIVFQRRLPEIGEELGAETNWIWSISKHSSIWQWWQRKGRTEVAGRWSGVRRGGWSGEEDEGFWAFGFFLII